MAFIDGTVVNVALPSLQANFHATVQGVQWVVESYALFLAALLLVGGSLGDHFGRKRIYGVGVALFAVSSVWCGLAPNLGQLIAARAVQGVGGALLVPGSLAIIGSSFRPEERGRAIGTWSGFTAITAAIGPVMGGWLIDHVSWRAAFLINIPIAAAVLAITARYVPESRDPAAGHRLDWLGAALATLSLGTIVYGLIESSRLGFNHPQVLAALIGGAITSLLLVGVEWRVQEPMLPLALFRSREFSGANLLTLFLYMALAGGLFFLPLNLIQVQSYTATAAGAAMLPFIVIMFLLSRWSGGLVVRYGARLPMIVGPIIAGLGFGLFMVPGAGGSYWRTFFPAAIVLGLGMATTVAPLTTTVMGAVSESRAGIASGVNNAVSRTAGLLAIAVLGIIMQVAFNDELDQRLTRLRVAPEVQSLLNEQRVKLAGIELPASIPEEQRRGLKAAIDGSFIAGYRAVMGTAAALALLGALSAGLLIGSRPIGVRRPAGISLSSARR